jgi:D-sedoheptulose 7-phosphate isomerase
MIQELTKSANTVTGCIRECGDDILSAARIIAACFQHGGKLLLCGNGGSAADCQHMAAEFMGGMGGKITPRPAVALTTDSSFLTAWSNDRDFDSVFSQQVDILGHNGDVLIGISTSGASVNVRHALYHAAAKGIQTIALTGARGMHAYTDLTVNIRVPSANTQHIQEAHLAIEHLIVGLVERMLAE